MREHRPMLQPTYPIATKRLLLRPYTLDDLDALHAIQSRPEVTRLHPEHHGRGLAGEAAAVLLRLGFEDLGLHRVIGRFDGRCDGRNTASAKVMERLGMRREAHFRQNELVKGEWCDELVYAILAEERFAGAQQVPGR
jgi:RimJ/RimL family protein N-acetyltransferase